MNLPLPTYSVPQSSATRVRHTNDRNDNGACEAICRHHLTLGNDNLDSPQYGILGRTTTDQRIVAADWDLCHCWSIFGSPNRGKSYALQVLVESASMPIPRLNKTVKPLCTVIFHFAKEDAYRPEGLAVVRPNSNAIQVESLAKIYGGMPYAHDDVVHIAPATMRARRDREFSHLNVKREDLLFNYNELDSSHWRLLVGAVGTPTLLMRVMNNIIRQHEHTGETLTAASIEAGILASRLPQMDKDEVVERLAIARNYVHDGRSLKSLMKPGRIIVVDMRDRTLFPEEAFAIMVVALQVLSSAMDGDRPMQKLCIFDEAHTYMTPEAAGLIDVVLDQIRTRRHRALSLGIASQDPITFPQRIIELSDFQMLFGFDSPAWLRRVQEVSTPFGRIEPHVIGGLKIGEALAWSARASEECYTKEPVRIKIRPLVTAPGGSTITASGPGKPI